MVLRLLWNGLFLRQSCQWSLGGVEGCKYDTSWRFWWQLVVLVTVVSAPCRIDLRNVYYDILISLQMLFNYDFQITTDYWHMSQRAAWVGPTLGWRRDSSADVGPASVDLLCCLVSAIVCILNDILYVYTCTMLWTAYAYGYSYCRHWLSLVWLNTLSLTKD